MAGGDEDAKGEGEDAEDVKEEGEDVKEEGEDVKEEGEDAEAPQQTQVVLVATKMRRRKAKTPSS